MGTRPLALLSSAAIPREQLTAFLRQAGVEPVKSEHRIFDYVLTRGKASCWFDLDDKENYTDPEVDAQIERKLGSAPHTRIMLHPSDEPGSEQLAMEFVSAFARRWPGVVDNLSGFVRLVYSAQEVDELLRQGRGLRDEDRTVPRQKDPDEDQAFIPPWLEEYLPPGFENDPGFARKGKQEA